jgi:uncharacterized protein (DUF697 family)
MANVLQQMRAAVATLNPREVTQLAERPLHVGLRAAHTSGYLAMEDFLAPARISTCRRGELVDVLHRDDEFGPPREFDLLIYEAGLARPEEAFVFYPRDRERLVREVIDVRPELRLALSRHFEPFRAPVVHDIVHRISRENALFTLVTALPNIVPSWAQLPWAVAEFASDTTVLTTNQVRMAFLIAGASNLEVGYREQKGEIASIVAGGFGWRALARELVGKIPFGAGIPAKASVAYAGTYVMGKGLDRLYSLGYHYTRQEKRALYEYALERGKAAVAQFLEGFKKGNPA